MLISSKSEYGLRALLDIATEQSAGPVSRTGIAERQRIPLPFLTQVLRSLVAAGLLESTRGPAGGYHLGKSAGDISILDVIMVLQGPVAPAHCAAANSGSDCGHEQGCGLAGVWSRLQSASEGVLSQTSLADVLAGEMYRGATAAHAAPPAKSAPDSAGAGGASSEAEPALFTPVRKLDCIGDACPLPIARIAREMRELEPDQVLEVWADDEGSKADIPAWCMGTGNLFLGREEFGRQMKFMIRKAAS